MTRTLTLEDTETGISVAVSFDRWDGDRPQWHYVVRATAGEILAEGTDLRGGSGEEPCEAKGMESLLSFLSAYAEGLEYERRTGQESENGRLFPDSLRDAAEAIGSDGFYMLGESVRTGERV